MNLLQLRTKLRRKVQDVASQQWSDVECNEAINQAYYDIQAEVHIVNPEAIISWDYIDSVAGTNWYPLPPTFGFSSVSIKAQPGDEFVKLDEKLYEDIRSINGTSQYMTRRGEWIGIFPAPSVSVTQGIELMHKPIATLTVDADEPKLKLPLHNTIVLMAKIDLLGDTNEDSANDKARVKGQLERLAMWYNMDTSTPEFFSPRGL
jgi:hypothetical protein